MVDTNVLVAALRSNRVASHRLLTELGSGAFETCLSVPLVLEYEAVLLREREQLGLSPAGVADLLDYVCSVSRLQSIFFRWRPQLPDPRDDMVLEAAVAAGCRFIVTFNARDFEPSRSFAIRVVTPGDFLRAIGILR